MLTAFLAANPHTKPATRVMWGHTARCLREHFGADRPLRGIGRGEAEGFRQWLVGKKLAAATVARRLQLTRQIFGYAVRCEWIDRNPFAGVSHTAGNPRARQHYVTEAETARLIDAAPNWAWRTIIALARYGGLRTPSETLSLRLADLDWEHGATTVSGGKGDRSNLCDDQRCASVPAGGPFRQIGPVPFSAARTIARGYRPRWLGVGRRRR